MRLSLYVICTKSIAARSTDTKHCSVLNKKGFLLLPHISLNLVAPLFILCVRHCKSESSQDNWLIWQQSQLLFTITIDRSLSPPWHDNAYSRGARSYFLLLLRGELGTNTWACSSDACLREHVSWGGDNFIVVVIVVAIAVGFTLPRLMFSLATAMGHIDQCTCNQTNSCK